MSHGFVNHHVHSEYSQLDGMPSVADIVARAVDLGQTSVSVTDHGTLAGIPSMYREAKKAGIGFTPGCEMYFTQKRELHAKDAYGEAYYHLILLAYNNAGYHNLMKMHTHAHEEGMYYKPRVDYEILDRYHEGLVVTTSCLGGLVNKHLSRGDYQAALKEAATLAEIFGRDNTYIEVQNHGIADQLSILADQVRLSKDLNLPLLATCDSHYCQPGDSDYHDTLLCIGTKKQKSDPRRMKFEGNEFYLHSEKAMRELFPPSEFPGAVANTQELADRTEFTLPIDDDKTYLMPKVHTPEGLTETEALRQLAYAGAADPSRYGDGNGNIPEHVKEQLDYEISVADKMKFPGYFLIVANLVKKFAENGIFTGPGRGCLHPYTRVLTERGWKRICYIKPGDRVITHTGHTSKVEKVMVNATAPGEKLLTLHNSDGTSLTLTKKHKVLVARRGGDPEWRRAKDIVRGDMIVHAASSDRPVYEPFTVGGDTTTMKIVGDVGSQVIKDRHWGFAMGVIMSLAKVRHSALHISFKDCYEDLGETFVSCLRKAAPNVDMDVSCGRGGTVSHVSVRSETILSYLQNCIARSDEMIGVGTYSYSHGFVDGVRASSPRTASAMEVVCRFGFAAKALAVAAHTIGITSTVAKKSKKGHYVLLDRVDPLGNVRTTMVTSIEEVDPPRRGVYDLSIAGVPSFLTEGGTVHNSAPGSVMVYCLGITNVDPFAHDLQFERFLNPDRVSMPDIDIDIPRKHRQRALEIIEEEYGVGHVAHLTNYTTMQLKDAVTRVSKVFGFSPTNAQKLAANVSEWCETNGRGLRDLADMPLPNGIAPIGTDPATVHTILDHASRLEGTLTSMGVHACGIIITSDPIDNHFPIRRSPKAKLPICQFDGADAEALGGVKMDILGLINLDEIDEAVRNVRSDLGEDVDVRHLPLDDPKTFSLLSAGRGGGVFQVGCVAGDTVVDGRTIKDHYDRAGSDTRATKLNSLFIGRGRIMPNQVVTVAYSGKKPVLTVTTAGGRTLSATHNHMVWTQRGWVAVGELVAGNDQLLSVDLDRLDDASAAMRDYDSIVNLYCSMYPGVIKDYRMGAIMAGEAVVYPKLRTIDDDGLTRYIVITPEDFPYHHNRLLEEVADSDGENYRVSVVTQTSVVEEAISRGFHVLMPDGTAWDTIATITDGGVVDTYDFVMLAPANNYIANGLVVHNSNLAVSLLRHMKPEQFSHIATVIALGRPGPIGEGTHEEFCERKSGRHPVDSYHKDLDHILAKNYGLMVYQEDIMAIAKAAAGYSGGEADELRKAIAKKKADKMDEQKRRFIPLVNEKFGNGLGEKLWSIIEPFGDYGFCAAHATAYAMTTYTTAYLKAHYPAQFGAAVIDNVLSGSKDKVIETIGWIRDEGVDLVCPSVNDSLMRSVTTRDSVILPLFAVRGVGEKEAQNIIDERNANGLYTSVVDFVARNNPSASLVIALAKAGAFDCLGASRAAVVTHIDAVMSVAKSKRHSSSLQAGLFGGFIDVVEDDELVDVTTAPATVDIDGNMVSADDDLYSVWERQALDFLVSHHPFETLRTMSNPQARHLVKSHPPVDVYDKPQKKAPFSGMITQAVKKISAAGNEIVRFVIETDRAAISGVSMGSRLEGKEGAIIQGVCDISHDGMNDDNGDDSEFHPSLFIPDSYDLFLVDIDVLKQREAEFVGENSSQ